MFLSNNRQPRCLLSDDNNDSRFQPDNGIRIEPP